MKFQFSENERILVALKIPHSVCKLKLIKKYRDIFLFSIDSIEVYNELMSMKNSVCYLDKFVLLLPDTYAKQKKIWINFYRLFGEEYEKFVDIKHNLGCIETMLKYIIEKRKVEDMFNVLDYGCGSGLSLSVEYDGEIVGYEPIKKMRFQARKRGMTVYNRHNFKRIPDNYFDAIFSCYVLHMGIEKKDIEQIIPKMKQNAIWIANYYKNINENYVNELFKTQGFVVTRIMAGDERYGHVYEYKRE